MKVLHVPKQDTPEMLLCNACGRMMPRTLVESRTVDGVDFHICLNWTDCRRHWVEEACP